MLPQQDVVTLDEKVTVKRLAAVLHEPDKAALAWALRRFGEDCCVLLLADALTLAHEGGMRRKDDRRRKRSLGGIFLELCKQQARAEDRRQIFG